MREVVEELRALARAFRRISRHHDETAGNDVFYVGAARAYEGAAKLAGARARDLSPKKRRTRAGRR